MTNGMRFTVCLAALVSISPLVAGCRGQQFQTPPRHLFWDMDWQAKYHPEGESNADPEHNFAGFADGRAMRPLVEGTIARGELRDDVAAGGFYTGKVGDAFLAKVPYEVDAKVLARGQERFNIYCSPCHDKTGSGHGTVVKRGFHIPVDLSSDHTRTIGDGEIFSYISKGVRNMPAYNVQIPEKDRWAIVSWVRVIQRSQHASLSDVPSDKQGSIEADPTATPAAPAAPGTPK